MNALRAERTSSNLQKRGKSFDVQELKVRVDIIG